MSTDIFYKEIDKIRVSIYKLLTNTDDIEKLQKIIAIHESLKEL